MTPEEKIEALAEIDDRILLADGFEEALIGYTGNQCEPSRAVYSCEKCLEIMMTRDNMTYEEAIEYLSFNTFGAYVGIHGPVFIWNMCAEEI
jgi:hypothetical protein